MFHHCGSMFQCSNVHVREIIPVVAGSTVPDYSDINGISHSLTLTYISNPAEDVLTGLEDRSSGQAGSVMDPI